MIDFQFSTRAHAIIAVDFTNAIVKLPLKCTFVANMDCETVEISAAMTQPN